MHRTIKGDLKSDDFATYKELPFDVPAGVAQIRIEVSHDGRGRATVLDLGLRDPAGFRGWSGSNKTALVVSQYEATPSYRAGPILPGRWTLILGIPAMATSGMVHYRAEIAYSATARATPVEPSSPAASKAGPGWRRGDLHMHTGHSDGSCANSAGVRVPCPVYLTLEAARRAHLDFIAVTDHNTFAQNASLAELAPFYPDLTLVRGAEITTFLGHANAIGTPGPLDFQLGSAHLPKLSKLLDQIEAQGGLLSLSHPGLVSGRTCMGCGWTADTDFSRIAAVEAVNGGQLRAKSEEGPTSGLVYWTKLLDQGFHVTAIGGSDNHDATDVTGKDQSPIGRPTTVVWAQSATERDIVAGIRSGNVFLDLANQPGRALDVLARVGSQTVRMGGVLTLPNGVPAEIDLALTGADGGTPEPHAHGAVLEPIPRADGAARWRANLAPGAALGYVRFDVRGPDGRLMLIGNPIWLKRG